MVDSSREAFEKWVTTQGESWLTRDKDGILYRSNVAQWQWEAWQASRSAAIEECAKFCVRLHAVHTPDSGRVPDCAGALRTLKGEG